MKNYAKSLTWTVIATLAATGAAWAQNAATDTPVAGEATAVPVNPPAEGATAAAKKKEIKSTVDATPDYKALLNNTLTLGGTGTAKGAPTEPPVGATLPPSRLYQPLPTLTDQHIKDVLGKYNPSNSTYTQNRASFELLQQQMQRRQIEQGMNTRLGAIATSNPDLYRQQLTQEVSSVLGERTGVTGTGQADLQTLLNVDRNTTSTTPLSMPDRQYVAPVTGAVTPSSGFSGSSPALDHVSRINASLGNSPDLRRFQGLQQFSARTYTNYGAYLGREYGVNGTSQAYSVPRAYQYGMMSQDAQALKNRYGINVDPNRMTYSDLWRLRTGM